MGNTKLHIRPDSHTIIFKVKKRVKHNITNQRKDWQTKCMSPHPFLTFRLKSTQKTILIQHLIKWYVLYLTIKKSTQDTQEREQQQCRSNPKNEKKQG
jgi:hypothetical protein